MIKDIYEWLETAGQVSSEKKVDLAINLIEEELQELKDAWAKGDIIGVLDAVVDLYWVVTNVPYFAGESLEEVQSYVNKVSISNWSKFCTSQDMAEVTVDLYKKGEHPDKLGQKIDCYYERVGQFWIVKRTDGKILKSIYWISPV